jgi:hypothetical protein
VPGEAGGGGGEGEGGGGEGARGREGRQEGGGQVKPEESGGEGEEGQGGGGGAKARWGRRVAQKEELWNCNIMLHCWFLSALQHCGTRSFCTVCVSDCCVPPPLPAPPFSPSSPLLLQLPVVWRVQACPRGRHRLQGRLLQPPLLPDRVGAAAGGWAGGEGGNPKGADRLWRCKSECSLLRLHIQLLEHPVAAHASHHHLLHLPACCC